MTTVKHRHPTRTTPTTLTLALAALLPLALLAGCKAGGQSERTITSSGGGGGAGRPTPTPQPSTETPIPANATLVASNKNPGVALSFTAAESGHVYLLDATDKKLKLNTTILKGQKIATNPVKGVVLLGGRELQKMTFEPDHFYEIYYTQQ
jgi:hypothetical protein